MKYFLNKYSSYFLTFIVLLTVGKISVPAFYILFTLFQIVLIYKNRITEQLATVFFCFVLSDGPFFFQIMDSYKAFSLILTFLHQLKLPNNYLLTKNFKILSPFALLAFLSLYYSTNVLVSFQRTISYLIAFISFTGLLLQLNDKKAVKEFLTFVVLGLTICLIFGHVFSWIGLSSDLVKGRFNGLFRNPNGLGLFSVLLGIFVYVNWRLKLLNLSDKETYFILLLILLEIVLAGSRNSLLAVILFLFLISINKYHPFFSVLGFTLLIFLNSSFESIVFEISNQFGLNEYLRISTLKEGSGRIIAWTFIYDNVSITDYIGHGFFQTETLFAKNYNKLSMMGHQGNAHNSFLTFWYDVGILGLTFIMLAFFQIFKNADKKTHYALPVFLTFMFTAFFESWLTASLNPFTFLFFLIISVFTFLNQVQYS